MRNFIVLLIILFLLSCNQESKNTTITGPIFGTWYSIQYYSENNLDFENQFDSLFYEVNKSLSTYQTNSIISKVNRSEVVKIDNHFKTIYERNCWVEVWEDKENGARVE